MRGNYTDTSSYFTVYPYGEMVLVSDLISEYYMKWIEGVAKTGDTFTLEGSTYYLSDYSVGGYGIFSGFDGVITSYAFASSYLSSDGEIYVHNCSKIYSFETNARIIEGSAFEAIDTLTKISLSKCSYIGTYAFGMDSNLSSIVIPKCEYIESFAFYTWYPVSQGSTTLDLPSCRYIGEAAFRSHYHIYSLSLPVCTYIGDGAFGNCNLGGRISLPVVQFVGQGAFTDCRNSSISLPECREFAGATGWTSLSTISLPKCTVIGDYGFRHCGLGGISLPSCKRIGHAAFEFCPSLVTISIPECEYIGSYAFDTCSSLKSVSVPRCSYIGDYTFKNCVALRRLYLMGSSVCELGSDVFSGAGVSYRVYVPESLYDEYLSAENWSLISGFIYSSTP